MDLIIPVGAIYVIATIGIMSLTRHISNIRREKNQSAGKANKIFWTALVTMVIVILIAGVYLWYNSRMTSTEIAKGNVPEVLPFKDHSSPLIAQPERISPKCWLYLMPDPTGIDNYIPYAFGVKDGTLMPHDSQDGYFGKGDLQIYSCTQSTNPKYKNCEFASDYFQKWLFYDKMYNGPIAKLAYKPVTYCEEVKLSKEELIFPCPTVKVVDKNGNITLETARVITERIKKYGIADE